MTETVKTPTVKRPSRSTIEVTWTLLDADDSGAAIDLSEYPDQNVQVIGTYNGATMTLYGTDDPLADTDRIAGTLFGSKTATWGILKDTLGANIAIASGNQAAQILANTKFVLPVITGGGGSTALTVLLKGHRNRI